MTDSLVCPKYYAYFCLRVSEFVLRLARRNLTKQKRLESDWRLQRSCTTTTTKIEFRMSWTGPVFFFQGPRLTTCPPAGEAATERLCELFNDTVASWVRLRICAHSCCAVCSCSSCSSAAQLLQLVIQFQFANYNLW